MAEDSAHPLVSIVLPVYNEAAILHAHVLLLVEHLQTLQDRYRFEIILVNDGSRDESGVIAAALARQHDLLSVYTHSRNFGLGQALRTGFTQCRGAYVVILDIDLSYAPDIIERLLGRLIATGARVVYASPYMRGGSVSDVPRGRVLLSRVANWFLARAAGHRLSTLTCMVRAYDARFLKSLHLRAMGMDVMPEMVHKANILRGSYEEIPAELNWKLQRKAGVQRRSSMRVPKHIFDTLRSGFMLRPFSFLLIPGLLLLVFALDVSVWVVIHVFDAYRALGTGGTADVYRAVALAYQQFPYTFIVGLLSLMLAIQLTGMAMLTLQNKRYFDELFHLGSTMLRQQREALQERETVRETRRERKRLERAALEALRQTEVASLQAPVRKSPLR
jgi:glycosyltransferase involved in cell wall biosynthesis